MPAPRKTDESHQPRHSRAHLHCQPWWRQAFLEQGHGGSALWTARRPRHPAPQRPRPRAGASSAASCAGSSHRASPTPPWGLAEPVALSSTARCPGQLAVPGDSCCHTGCWCPNRSPQAPCLQELAVGGEREHGSGVLRPRAGGARQPGPAGVVPMSSAGPRRAASATGYAAAGFFKREIFATRAIVTHRHLIRSATSQLVCSQHAPTLILENELPIVHIYVDMFSKNESKIESEKGQRKDISS